MSQDNVDVRLIGVIGKPHGIKGELNVMMVTDYPNTVVKGSILFMDQECSMPAEVENIRQKILSGRKVSVIKLVGIDGRDGAERLKGTNLYRSGSGIPVLEDGKFWVDDLAGCRVFLCDGTSIGRVEDVEILTSNENLAVIIENRDIAVPGKIGNIVYIPLVEDYIENIDISSKKIILKKLPEYM